jgi:uncharacterized protein with ParB-like and HNH nuclease domain
MENITENRNIPIPIGVINLKDLFLLNTEFIFSIPDYQRPYVWDEEKVETLFKDIAEELKSDTQQNNYYLGAILMHKKNDNELEIIDGQQRITTLLILDYIINNDTSLIKQLENQLQLKYNSPISQENIERNKKFIIQNKDRFFSDIQLQSMLEYLIFTVIVTQSEDDAFAFFDTQNNRGVKLSAVDFLKSYHLKSLKGESEETAKQKLAAKVWDKSNQNQFLDKLFNLYLWRGRAWKGKKVEYENKDKVLLEFQKKTKPKPKDNSVTLFANNKNRLATSIQFSVKKGINIRTNDISLQASPKDYPFTLRQPIEKGMSFFLFTEKYNSLYKYIFQENHDHETELFKLNEFYKSVYKASGFSHYFTDVFELCVILYFDKFEESQLLEFTLWLDYLLGAYRIKQNSIVAQTPIKIIREGEQNLLDIIDGAFLQEEIFEFLQNITPKEYYQSTVGGNGVQGNYKREVLKYYGKEASADLDKKQEWIYAKLKN